ncbi:MAG: gas vesicle protein GvpN [uncultured archaeon A07HR60]|nr:MAG: gas vesicle protein GvpN [uncultured archaeon A07HR60]
MATHLAQERERPVVWINGDADLTTSDLVGEYGETEQITEHDKYIHNVVKSKNIVRDRWVDNPLTIAVREGATLVYNEFSRTKPVANNVLLSVFEEGVLELPGQRGESRYVDVHPEFRAVLTSNSVEYAGVHEPQDALLDRLVGIYMDHYDHETEAAIISSHVSDPDAERIEPIVDLMGELRDRLDIEVGTRAGIMAVEGLEYADDPDRATLTNICVDVLASKLAHHSEVQALRQEVEAAIDKLDTTAP